MSNEKDWLNIYLEHAGHEAHGDTPRGAVIAHLWHVGQREGWDILCDNLRASVPGLVRKADQWALNLLLLPRALEDHQRWMETKRGPKDPAKGEIRFIPRSVDLRGANLKEVNLRGTSLDRARLEGANLKGADLVVVNLQGVHLREADLTGAELKTTNLEGAHLERTNLEGANLTVKPPIGGPISMQVG